MQLQWVDLCVLYLYERCFNFCVTAIVMVSGANSQVLARLWMGGKFVQTWQIKISATKHTPLINTGDHEPTNARQRRRVLESVQKK